MERWKDISGYQGLYKVSSWGKVKSLDRIHTCERFTRKIKGKIIKGCLTPNGYLCPNLYRDSMSQKYSMHTLVWDHFGNRPRNGMKLLVDHVNNVKTDNYILNLQLLTAREHMIKHKVNKTGLTGVTLRSNGTYYATIQLNGKTKNLGSFETPEKASNAYQIELLKI